MHTIWRISSYLFRYRSLFWLTIGLALCSTLFFVAVPKLARMQLEALQTDSPLTVLVQAILVIGGCFVGRELFNGLRIRANNTLEQRVLVDMRRDLHQKLLALPVSFYDKNKSGEVASRVVEDVANVERALLDGTEQGSTMLLQMLGVISILFYTDAEMALFVVAPLPFLLTLSVNHARMTRKNWKHVREASADLNALLVEDIQGNRLIHSFALGKREAGRFEEKAHRLRDVTLKAMYRWGIYHPLSNFITSLGILAVLGVGGYRIIQGAGMPAEAFLEFFWYGWMLYDPVSRFTMINHMLAAGKSSGDRVFEILDHPIEVQDPEQPKPFPEGLCGVHFENVDFKYHERETVLERLDLKLRAGEVTALVGHTGAGKSTIANLLMRYYDVSSGSVTINGRDVREMGLVDLRSHIGYVAQEPFLFEGTVADNLYLARPDASEEDLIAALRSASAWEFVSKLPDGVHTNIGEKGIRLSQGEKQRLTIARVLLKNPPIVIFDEATASVDTITERKIQEALDNLMSERTVLVIAHRLSTVRKAQKIVVLEDGKIIETGDHESLLKQKGHYSHLWYHQVDLLPEVHR